MPDSPARNLRLRELALLFLKLGATSFGGPLAHIALMEGEVVTRRKWLSREEFLDLVGATNLIPGPNSTEMAIHIGWLRAGWVGLLVAGVSFILPAFVLVLALSVIYARFGTLPSMRGIFAGVTPVVVAIIAYAGWKFSRTALKNRATWIVALGALSLVACGVDEVSVIALSALAGLVAAWKTLPNRAASDVEDNPDNDQTQAHASRLPALLLISGTAGLTKSAWGLFWVFLKIGSVIYGSGYVLLAFLRADLVARLKWLPEQGLLDAVAVGQMTPGPLFTTATFIGYQIAGFGGALAATIGIFLSSFLLVAFLAKVLEKMRGSPRARIFLDWVNAASLALMAFVAFEMARETLLAPCLKLHFMPLVLAVAAGIALWRGLNATWLLTLGGLLGLAGLVRVA